MWIEVYLMSLCNSTKTPKQNLHDISFPPTPPVFFSSSSHSHPHHEQSSQEIFTFDRLIKRRSKERQKKLDIPMTVSKFLYCLMLQDKMAQRSSFSVEGAEKKKLNSLDRRSCTCGGPCTAKKSQFNNSTK